ncbi:MAG: hypothetical protein JW801_09465 [Bacteroidales bacterium]|nr:hypothetical protein [Bacteroidales bacterium]
MITAGFQKIILLLAVGLTSLRPLPAQNYDYFLGTRQYSFIRYEENQIIFPENQGKFDSLFSAFNLIRQGGQQQIRILHLGGSHIQADIYTHLIRGRMQELGPDMRGARGLIFPLTMAKTNNPRNYTVAWKGSWESCKSTRASDPCVLGLTGMAVYTSDSVARISIRLNNNVLYSSVFDSVRIFHEPTSYRLRLISPEDTISGTYDDNEGCTWFLLDVPTSIVQLDLTRTDKGASFTLLGISLDNDVPGIVYDAVGVNGAKLSSFLNCELYDKHVHATHPDLVIISIGTNDGYTRNFNKERYYLEYKSLLEKTMKQVPEAAFILTVPNDSYLYRRYINNNTEEMRKIIFRLAKEYQCGVWDFYTIMGGLNSVQAWHSLKLMNDDRIHFTREGYEIKGDLFFAAFLKEWEKSILAQPSLNTAKND